MKHRRHRILHLSYKITVGVLVLALCSNARAADSPWQMTGSAQAYWQNYSGSDSRDNAFNAGYYAMADYLDTTTLGVAYNYSLVNLANNADITEHLFYLSGRHSLYPDALPGRLTLRVDAYFGKDTLAYNNKSSSSGGGMGGGSSSTAIPDETTNITAWQPVVSFINYSKTLYLDLGYAYSNYDGNPDVKASQLTPTFGFGWNDSYDWLQLRAYLISLDEKTALFNDDRFTSLEVQYSHWYPDAALPQIEFLRVTLLGGERALAVDPDAGALYSTADRQTGSLAFSLQWKLNPTLKVLAMAGYGKYKTDATADDYNSLLFYMNLQHQW